MDVPEVKVYEKNAPQFNVFLKRSNSSSVTSSFIIKTSDLQSSVTIVPFLVKPTSSALAGTFPYLSLNFSNSYPKSTLIAVIYNDIILIIIYEYCPNSYSILSKIIFYA
jgi:hypothetical protein